MTYCIFTGKQMYTVEADFFKIIDDGVMFFKDDGKTPSTTVTGVAFVPMMALELVREYREGGELAHERAKQAAMDIEKAIARNIR